VFVSDDHVDILHEKVGEPWESREDCRYLPNMTDSFVSDRKMTRQKDTTVYLFMSLLVVGRSAIMMGRTKRSGQGLIKRPAPSRSISVRTFEPARTSGPQYSRGSRRLEGPVSGGPFFIIIMASIQPSHSLLLSPMSTMKKGFLVSMFFCAFLCSLIDITGIACSASHAFGVELACE
jgi:hypothetical protein